MADVNRDRVAWALLAAGLAAMYIPTIYDLARTLWSTEQQGHGPIVLALAVWQIWRRWPAITAPGMAGAGRVSGSIMIGIACVAYVIGRSQDIWLFEVGSSILMLAGCIVLMRGMKRLRVVAFPLFFMFFLIPLPGSVVDALTQPMKMAVSYATEQILFALGYPISRNGVILQIGQYQLMVADACAGLHTLFTLEALGLLYLNVVKHSSALRNIGLAILIVPVSFSANVLRVMALTLITYYFGDEAGQGFLHGFAGMVLFLSALMLIISFDTALRSLQHVIASRRATA